MQNGYDRLIEWLKDLLEGITGRDVEIKLTLGTTAAIIEIFPAQDDFGKIVGREGKTITAVRYLCFVARNNFLGHDAGRLEIDVIDPQQRARADLAREDQSVSE